MNRSSLVLVILGSMLLVIVPCGVSQSNEAISVLTPTGTDEYNYGDPCIIRWSLGWNSDPIPVNIYLCKGNTVLGYIILGFRISFAYSWIVPSLADGNDYRILVVDSSDESNSDLSAYFTISSDVSITLTYPAGQECLETEHTYTITWKSTGTIPTVDIFLLNEVFPKKTLSYGEKNDGSYLWILVKNDVKESDSYQISIEYSNDPSISDTSGHFTIIHSIEDTENDDNGDDDNDGGNNDSNNNDTLPSTTVPSFDLFFIIFSLILVSIVTIIKIRGVIQLGRK